MQTTNRSARGFSLMEVTVGLATLGVVLAVSVPAIAHYGESHDLSGATETVASQIRLARSLALGTGVDQQMLFETDSKGATCKIVNSDGSLQSSTRLPGRVMYDALTSRSLTMQRNGCADRSSVVVLCDTTGKCDTVSVECTGFVISR
jgi:Tfp pilus assembly protein FimT